MFTLFKEIFSNRNMVVISATTVFVLSFDQIWNLWWSLYILELGAPIAIVGLLSTVQNTSMILFQLPGGMVADRIGRKRVILLGSSCKIISPLILLFARTWQQVIPGFIFNAISGLYLPAFNAIIAESLPSKRRGSAFGAQRAISSSPSIFIPVISGLYMSGLGIINGVRITLTVNIVTAIFVFTIRLLFLRETLVDDNANKMSEKKTFRKDLSTLTQSLTESRTLLLLVIISSIGSFATRMVFPFLTIYAVDVIGLDKTQWGLLNSIASALATPLYMFGGVLSDRIGRVPCIVLARFIAPLQYIGLLTIHNFNGLILLFILLGIGGGLGGGGIRGGGYMGGPAWQALLADIVPDENRAKVFGFLATLTGLTSLPSSLIGGYIWEMFNPSVLLTIGLTIGASIIPIMVTYLKEPKKAS